MKPMKRIRTVITTIALVLCFAVVSWGAGYHATGLTPEDSRSSFATNDSWLAWDGLDFSAYNGADGNWFIRLVDGSGNVAEGYAGSVGTGETFGGELHTNANAISDPHGNEADDITGWTCNNLGAGGNVCASQGGVKNVGNYAIELNSNDTPTNNAYLRKDIGSDWSLSAGKLYNLTYDSRHVGTGGYWIVALSSIGMPLIETLTNTDITFNPVEYYFVGSYKWFTFRELGDDTGGVYIDNLSCKQITEPAATGIHILDGPSGSAAWAKIDSGFAYNDIVEIEILPAATLAGVTLTGVSVN